MKVSVEYGHTYAADGIYTRGMPAETIEANQSQVSRELTAFEQSCKALGDTAATMAVDAGFEVTKHLLIDDVEWAYKQKGSQDSGRWATFRWRVNKAAEALYEPDETVSEAELVGAAIKNATNVREKLDKTGKYVKLDTRTGEQRVSLTGFKGVDDTQHPSCDVLDLSWHQKRGEDAEVLVTILHESYETQQARVHALAEVVADDSFNNLSIASLLVDDNGRASRLLQAAQAYFESLQSLVETPDVATPVEPIQ
jgi:hypothetical protein